MSSVVRIVAARSGVRVGAAAVKSNGTAGLVAASRAGTRSSYAGVAASCRVSQLTFTRSFVSTADDKAAAAMKETATKKAAPKKAAAKKTAVKKTAAKKTTAKKTTAKKTAAKKTVKKVKAKKPVKKAKKVKAKPKKVVKVLTEEQKVKKAAAAERKAVRALRAAALLKGGPATLPTSSWVVYTVDNSSSTDANLPPTGPKTLGERMGELSRRFKALSAQELDSLRARAAENQVKNQEAYKEWVASYSPEEIQAANKARRALVRLAKEKKASALPPRKRRQIEDHRVPKKGLPPFAIYTREQWATGDYSTTITNSVATIAAKWKALSPEERKKYEERSAAEIASRKEDIAAALGKLSL